MKIEYLFFADCPSHEEGLARLRRVLAREGIEERVEVIEVKTDDQARKLGFIGSPTIRFDGRDIDPAGLEGQASALTCRVYRLPDGRYSALPSEEMIRRALYQEKE
ncbi:MAG: DUF2703 domain-containing protein [Candidatus Glassbacteria bacterium]